jgi:phosphatidylinositol phospholipase C delta
MVTVENAKFKSFDDSMALDRCISCSWGEAKLLSRAQSTEKSLMISFTKRHLLRCYPAGRRIMSDNYDPSPAWSIGAQMVALNFQANDMPTWINRGKFSANGGSGYILKPKHLLDPSAPKPSEPVCALSVSVIAGSGWDNFKDAELMGAPDTYIRVTITGCVSDAKTFTTSVFTDQRTGPRAQPYFNESFKFDIFDVDLALLLFTVYDKDTVSADDFLAQYCCPVSMLRSGVRILPLYDEDGKYIGRNKQPNPCLVVKIHRSDSSSNNSS